MNWEETIKYFQSREDCTEMMLNTYLDKDLIGNANRFEHSEEFQATIELMKSYQSYKNMRNESKSIYRCNGLLHYNLKLLNKMRKMHTKFDKLEIDIESLSENYK